MTAHHYIHDNVQQEQVFQFRPVSIASLVVDSSRAFRLVRRKWNRKSKSRCIVWHFDDDDRLVMHDYLLAVFFFAAAFFATFFATFLVTVFFEAAFFAVFFATVFFATDFFAATLREVFFFAIAITKVPLGWVGLKKVHHRKTMYIITS